MKNEPKMHHFVPESYLRRFAYGSYKSSITVWDKVSNKTFQQNVGDIACSKHYNEVEDESDPLKWEKFYSSDYESKLIPILCNISSRKYPFSKSAQIMTNMEKEQLSRQIIVQLFRTISAREFVRNVVEGVWEPTKSKILAKILPPQQSLVETKIEEIHRQPKTLLAMELDYLNDQPTIDRMAELLQLRVWVLYRAKEEFPFVTSDTPVVLRHVEKGQTKLGETGLADNGIFTYYPISPTECIAIYPDRMTPLYQKFDCIAVDVKPGDVWLINEAERMSCHRQIFTNISVEEFS